MSASERLGGIVGGGDPEIRCSGLQRALCSFESTGLQKTKHSKGAWFPLSVTVWKGLLSLMIFIWDNLGHFMEGGGAQCLLAMAQP